MGRSLSKRVYVNGVEYELSGLDQVVVNGPIILVRPMYVQVTAMGTSTTAMSTRTNHQAPQTTTSNVSSLLTVALAGLILITLIWPVSELEVGGMAPKSIKNKTNTHT